MIKLILLTLIIIFIGTIIYSINFLSRLNNLKKVKNSSKENKLEKQIKSINKKLDQLKNDLKYLPDTDDEIISELKESLNVTIKKLEDELEHLCKLYAKSFFKNVYIIYSLDTEKNFSENIKKIYSILAEKYFKNPNIEFITKKELYKKIEDFNRNYLCNLWDKNYIDVICILEKDKLSDSIYIENYCNIVNVKNSKN
jgi:hypothetical protein